MILQVVHVLHLLFILVADLALADLKSLSAKLWHHVSVLSVTSKCITEQISQQQTKHGNVTEVDCRC